MNISNGRVEQLGTKSVNTKFGAKDTYSIKVDGKWYKCGFKDPKLAVGEVVSFSYTPGKFGDEVDTSTISKGAASAAAPAAAPADPAPRPSGGGKGVFPIPALDGQRSIVRQNALTNAREMFVASLGAKGFTLNIDDHAAVVIGLAKKFEAYTAGDMDMEMAKAAVEGEVAVKH